MTTSIRSEATQSVVSVNGVDRLTINNDGSVELLTDNLFPSGKDVVGMVNFGSSLAANGYQKLPSGLIIQWGVRTAGTAGTGSITFPISFPLACVIVSGTDHAVDSSSAVALAVSSPPSTTGFTFHTNATNGGNFFWFAIGY